MGVDTLEPLVVAIPEATLSATSRLPLNHLSNSAILMFLPDQAETTR